MEDNLVIERVTIDQGRACCDVCIADPHLRYSTPSLMERLAKNHPDLPSHTCVNDHGATFAAVMNTTSIPHVLEHLVIDLQAQLSTPSPIDPVFVGTTHWTCESRGKARIEVSFTDDLVVLRAFRDASRILNNAMVK